MEQNQSDHPLKILLTGADGFLGVSLIYELLNRGYFIRAFIEPSRGKNLPEHPNIEKFSGDILNADSLEKAAADCDAIIHTAACTDLWPSRSAKVRNINYEGTSNIIQTALKLQIKRLVYVSTANSFGFGNRQNPGNEETAYCAGKYKLDYLDSKYAAQQLILDTVKNEHLPAIILNPTFMFGPYDSKPGAGAMIQAVYYGKIPGYTSGGRNFAYVKDVAEAIANALTMGRIGQCYILGNQNLTYDKIFGIIARTANVKAPAMKIPTPFIKIFGLIGTLAGKISGKAPAISYPVACISCDKHFYSSAKAIKELALRQTNIEIAVKESFDWLKNNGYLN